MQISNKMTHQFCFSILYPLNETAITQENPFWIEESQLIQPIVSLHRL